jgi:hypothetical protein
MADMFGIYLRYFLLVLIPLQFNLSAQEPVFKQFTTKDGLPSNETHFVLSDSRGYVWICTDAGIAKYNANTFKIFNTSNGMPDNTIFEVREDKTGKIWFRTFSNKIGYIANDTVYQIGANNRINSFAKEGKIISFAIDSNQDLYLGKQNTSECVFLKVAYPYDSSNVQIVRSKLNNKCGLDVLILKNQNVVFTEARKRIDGSMYRINVLDKDLNVLIKDSIDHTETFPVSKFLLLNGTLFYTTKASITKYDIKAKLIERQTGPFHMLALGLGKDSLLLIGASNIGVSVFRPNLQKLAGNFLEGTSPTCISKDIQDGLWISTLESGVYYYSPGDLVKYKLDKEFGSTITSMAKNNYNSILVGLTSGSVYELTFTSDNRIISKDFLDKNSNELKDVGSGNNILLPVSKDKMFIGRYTRNLLYKGNKFKELDLSPSVKSGIVINNKVFLYSMDKVYETDTSFSKIEHLGGIKDRISGIAYSKNEIYVSGLKGLYKYNSSTGNFVKDLRFNNRIEGMAESNGKIYMATKYNGVVILSNNKIDTISENKGLLSNICNSILITEREIWVITNRGISRIIHNSKSYEIQNYPLEYFVEPVSIKQVCTLGDYLLFYCGNIIYAFNSNIKKLKDKCSITSVYTNKELYHGNERIILPYNASDTKIEFEALFYNLKGKVKYRYNYGKKWIYTNENTVHLTSLAPGKYLFQVEALNIDNKWIRSSNEIDITVQNPFWFSKTFIAICILLCTLIISSLIFGLNRRNLRLEKKKNQLNIQMIELESKAARALMNPHFIFNSLNALKGFILTGELESAEKYLDKFAKILRNLLENGASDKILIRDEIILLNNYLDIEKLRFDNSFDFKVETADEISNVYIPFMCIQPFVENAVWHGLMLKKGEKFLNISFSRLDENRVRCIVEDNGIGRNNASVKKESLKGRSLGMELIRQRLELIGKSKNLDCYFIVTDKKDIESNSLGTKIEIIIPIIS